MAATEQGETPPGTGRPRARVAEAQRNQRTLLEAATRIFATATAPVALETIARDAGVGIGTLYRHFPTREALVEAVYRDQVEKLETAALELLGTHPPAAAFRLWMDAFLNWAVTKHGMVDALRSAVSTGRIGPNEMRSGLVSIVSLFLARGVDEGDMRSDIDAADVAATLAGILAVASAPDQRAQAGRMLTLVADGLRPK
jgi:AcrR family transcriptional regulator